MNINIVRSYIKKYKENFESVNSAEIYKWKAIKKFQDSFNIDAEDFHENMSLSLLESDNLLSSKQYLPKGVLLEVIKENPEDIRELIRSLFDESMDVLYRIEKFREDFSFLFRTVFPEKKNHYQDHRAVVVYLTLRFPDRYFFYKFTVFQEFSEKIDYVHAPTRGNIKNIGLFQNLCELLRYEIEKDQELLALHEGRLNKECFRDTSYNVLTQDFIYAVSRHLDDSEIAKSPVNAEGKVKLDEVLLSEGLVNTITKKTSFKPFLTNHIQKNLEKKIIGDLGELWVYEQEKVYLKANGKEQLAKKVDHVAKSKGDGLGYDILSFGLDGRPKYIEVKTTKGSLSTTFYITRNELEKSIIDADSYFLYRVYGYKNENEPSGVLKIQGSLSNLCDVPVNFKVALEI